LLNVVARFTGLFARLSPRTLAWSASLGALALLLQAGIIGAVLMSNRATSFQTASLSSNEPVTRELALQRRRARWCGSLRTRGSPTSRHCSTISGLDRRRRQGRHVRLQFANRAMTKDDFSALISRLQTRNRQPRGGDALKAAAPFRFLMPARIEIAILALC